MSPYRAIALVRLAKASTWIAAAFGGALAAVAIDPRIVGHALAARLLAAGGACIFIAIVVNDMRRLERHTPAAALEHLGAVMSYLSPEHARLLAHAPVTVVALVLAPLVNDRATAAHVAEAWRRACEGLRDGANMEDTIAELARVGERRSPTAPREPEAAPHASRGTSSNGRHRN